MKEGFHKKKKSDFTEGAGTSLQKHLGTFESVCQRRVDGFTTFSLLSSMLTYPSSSTHLQQPSCSTFTGAYFSAHIKKLQS